MGKPRRIGEVVSDMNYRIAEEELAKILGIEEDGLHEVFQLRARPYTPNDPRSPYYQFSKEKENGGFRLITAPHDDLKAVQRRIYEKILRPYYTPTPIAHGFIPKRGIVTNARAHLRRDQLFSPKFALNVDVRGAFPSVFASRVIDIFKRIFDKREVAMLLAFLTTWEDKLPQGAPSSPALFNLAIKKFDRELQAWTEKHGLVATRYVDDITISDSVPLSKRILPVIEKMLRPHGFVLNPEKILWQDARQAALEITGLKIVEGQVKLPKKTVEWFRHTLHYATHLTDDAFGKHDLGTCIGMIGLVKHVQGEIPKRLQPLVEELRAMGRLPALHKWKQRKFRTMREEFELEYASCFAS